MKKIAFALSMMLALSQSTFAQKNTINVASYNLRYNTANDGVNAWPNRKENVKGLIRFHEFDIFGVQEALIGQLKDVAELTEFTFYGKGRDDGKEGGEHSAIFYKKDRFKALQSGDFWLSETPDKPGKGWDATCCNRIASWVKFQDLLSKKEFYFFNVHFDHQGVEARRQSGHLRLSSQVISTQRLRPSRLKLFRDCLTIRMRLQNSLLTVRKEHLTVSNLTRLWTNASIIFL
jgi:endonuclease/exonuclease/phosphatase family metal-dependent hydrolase